MSDETGFTIDPDTGQFRLDVSGVADLPDNVFEDVTFNPEFDIFNSPAGSGLFDSSGALNLDYIDSLTSDPAVFSAFAEFDPEAAAVIRNITGEIKNRSFGDQSGITTLTPGQKVEQDDGRITITGLGPSGKNSGEGLDFSKLGTDIAEIPSFDKDLLTVPFETDELVGPNPADSGDTSINDAETKKFERQAAGSSGVPVGETDTKTDTKPDTTGTNKGLSSLSDLLKYFLPALASYLSYKSAQDARKEARGASFAARGPVTSTRTTYGGSTYKPAAQGGLMSLAGGGEVSQPFYLGGPTDGMADEVPAHIDNKRPAALSDGEFVIPADVVSHLGNGNSNAGAKRLYEMMDNIRQARTGNKNQGIQINPNQFMPR